MPLERQTAANGKGRAATKAGSKCAAPAGNQREIQPPQFLVSTRSRHTSPPPRGRSFRAFRPWLAANSWDLSQWIARTQRIRLEAAITNLALPRAGFLLRQFGG